jgi:hypothetical protein
MHVHHFMHLYPLRQSSFQKSISNLAYCWICLTQIFTLKYGCYPFFLSHHHPHLHALNLDIGQG